MRSHQGEVSRGTLEVRKRTLAVILAASVCFLAGCRPAEEPTTLHGDGIGPLRLRMPYPAAVDATRRAAPDSVLAGPGCGDRDEVSFAGSFHGLPVTVMGMADDGILTEVEITLDQPRQASHEAACLELRSRLADVFIARFGTPGAAWEERKPVSVEHNIRIGPAVVVARWFPTGGSCYVSARYGESGITVD
jgi:hypothetical protein